ncbi:hypothetical protein HDU87_000328 [Geranomyces variabilis]|uniref:Uncharacterized protein n=1 Tax=Geranomyces variabilis TaxID=109894 RepID=A0AAD5TTB5_9FUNG|nr:hypothetical protein HDU87_000328 [Geranomyces variabilis]
MEPRQELRPPTIGTVSQPGSADSLNAAAVSSTQTSSSDLSTAPVSPQSSSEDLAAAVPGGDGGDGAGADGLRQRKAGPLPKHLSSAHLQSPRSSSGAGLLRRMSSALSPAAMKAAIQRRRVSLTPTSKEKGVVLIVVGVFAAVLALWAWDTFFSSAGGMVRIVRKDGTVEYRQQCGDNGCD